MSVPFVLLYGATGRTGRDIIDGFLRVGGLRIGAITRSASSSTAVELKNLGIELVELDVSKETEEQVAEKLKSVDIIVSVVAASALESQRPLFKAAKAAGVKRVVPSDFGTPTDEGVMLLHDLKLGIHRYIQELGLGYTWIDVAWWKQLSLPHPPSVGNSFVTLLSYRFVGDGDKPFAVTDRRRIGDFVGRIIKDERTLNQYVFCHDDAVTIEQAWKLAQELSPEGDAIVAKKVHVSAEELQEQIKAARAALKSNPDDVMSLYGQFMVEYDYSMYIHGDDTLAKAKELGALDARELYPDLQIESLRDYAQAFYANPAAFVGGMEL